MQVAAKIRLVAITGLALFAMFFGAGNMIFPLKLGMEAGQHVLPAGLAFVITGVGVPFLGLFAVSLYEGDYWKFFERFGKVFAFVIITFLILIIGPLFAAPRTEIVTFNTLLPALPSLLQNTYVFDFCYFGLVFLLVCNQSRIVDIMGWFLSPIKILAFTVLIAIGLYTAAPLMHIPETSQHTFTSALTTGYGTMDLLAAFFFCTVAYKNIVNKCHSVGVTSKKAIANMTLLSCIVGAALISVVYIGLTLAAASHAEALQNVPTEALIGKISYIVLGQYGSVFVGICVTFACVATATALVEVTADYFHRTIFKEKLPRLVCVIGTLVVMYLMAILGFDRIMKIAGPILNGLYPMLIFMCVVNIFLKLVPMQFFFRKSEEGSSL